MKDKKVKRGFAAMSAEKRKEIASMGGKKSQANGTAHRWTKEEAKAAGKKGGNIVAALGIGHKFTSETARAAAIKAAKNR